MQASDELSTQTVLPAPNGQAETALKLDGELSLRPGQTELDLTNLQTLSPIARARERAEMKRQHL